MVKLRLFWFKNTKDFEPLHEALKIVYYFHRRNFGEEKGWSSTPFFDKMVKWYLGGLWP